MIPIITLDSKNLKKEILYSFQNYGFFYLNNKNNNNTFLIDPKILNDLENIAKKIFNIDLKEKLKFHVSKNKGNRGYFSSLDYNEINKDPDKISIIDNKEGYFFGSNNLYNTNNIIPTNLNNELKIIENYMELCKKICLKILNILNFNFDDPIYMFKILSYPPKNGNTDAHTDYGCLTMLYMTDDGLEININNEWIKIPKLDNIFVINAGDFLQSLTNNKVKSTIHRVIHLKNNNRFSFPFFYHANPDFQILINNEKFSTIEYINNRFNKTYKHRKINF